MTSKSYKNEIVKSDNEFDKSKNYLINNKSLNKINIINNNNRYLNFNILPGINMNNQKEINNIPEIKKISDNIFNYSDVINDINKDLNKDLNDKENNDNNSSSSSRSSQSNEFDLVKKENENLNINNENEEDEKE